MSLEGATRGGPGPLAKLRLLVKAAEDNHLHEADIKVLAVLVDTIGRAGAGWWGFGTVAERIGKHRSAVVRSVAKLERLDYIRCQRTGGGSKENTTRYEMGQGPSSSTGATGSAHATSSTHAPDRSHPRTRPVAPTRHESVNQSVLESVEEKSSLRSDSSLPSDEGAHGVSRKSKSADIRVARESRIRQIAGDAQKAYNATLAKPTGLLSSCAILNKPRLKAVEKALPTIRAMCLNLYGAERVTAQFWEDYFAEVANDDFHSGRTKGGPGHENWKPDFEFLLRESVLAKVFDRAMTEAA